MLGVLGASWWVSGCGKLLDAYNWLGTVRNISVHALQQIILPEFCIVAPREAVAQSRIFGWECSNNPLMHCATKWFWSMCLNTCSIGNQGPRRELKSSFLFESWRSIAIFVRTSSRYGPIVGVSHQLPWRCMGEVVSIHHSCGIFYTLK